MILGRDLEMKAWNDCVDAILGGEIKMHVDFREEHIEQEENKKNK